MASSPLRGARSETSVGPERQELDGIPDGESVTDSWPNVGAPDPDRRPTPIASTPSSSRTGSKEYSGPARLELRTLNGWAAETRAALAGDVPPVHPAGRAAKPVSRAREDVGWTELGGERDHNPKSGRGTSFERPPPDDFQREIDEIQASLRKK
jgi:hypothetical protein